MASNPPFHVMEDQTDEDFFDKLVDDEFGSANSPPKFAEGSDSDEAKAFSNLSIEDNGGNSGKPFEMKGVEEFGSDDVVVERNDNVEERNDNVNLSNVVASNVVESYNSGGVGSEGVSDLISGKSIESAKSGVKEVGWNSFYPDSVPNGNHGFGSEPDFFSDLGGGLEEFPAKVEESVSAGNGGVGVLDNSVSHGVYQDGTQVYGLDNSVSHDQYQDGTQVYGLDHSVSHEQYQDGTQVYGGSTAGSAQEQDLNSSQYWESMYPGWKYDANTGQWYQVDGFDATSSTVQASSDANAGNEWGTFSDVKTEVSYLQLTSQPVAETVTDTGTTESVSSWNQVSQLNNIGYPEHMVFDPQYPGWYYDTIAQEWRSLESCTSSAQSAAVQTHDQPNQNGFDVSGSFSQSSSNMYNEYGQTDMTSSQGYNSHGHQDKWTEPYGGHNQQALKTWQQEPATKTTISGFSGNQQLKTFLNFSTANHVGQQTAFNSFGAASYDNSSFGNAEANGFVGSQNFMHSGNFGQQVNQGNLKQNEQMNFTNGYFGNQNEQTNFSNDFYGTQKAVGVSQQSFQQNLDYSHASNVGRSSAGRPPCALVNFGFGGKLIVMKPSSSLVNSSFPSQESAGGSISVLNMMEVVSSITDKASSIGGGNCDYFHALCQQSFPGPLVGGSVGNKELNKWIDERIAKCGSADLDYRKSEVLKLLLSLLKIACQHYGKLRSPFGTDISLKEIDTPESAVAKLFTSVKSNGTQFSEYGALSHCLHNLPSEGQIRATASEVQNLLVSGRKREALQCAQEGQLWGPALVLASQLGDQFYVDTIKQMALRQLVAGSPLRTLCLLIAGQPADVFSSEATHQVGLPGATNNSQQSAQFGENGMLDDWEENLAVITANRTKDDELVILHLGDCLWKDRSEIIAAHICYLVAEANFEAYSDSARLCLVGADHWKHPRTYASPQAIQRTELYEYSKVLGNSQFILLPFQPYKLIYAYMLAEVGKVSDSLKYCQAVLKSLKTGRAPEVETWKQLVLALEERIKTHQQGGYATNLAPAKLVGKLLNFFDSTAHRVVGGLPPPAPSASQGNFQGNEQFNQPLAPRVSTSQSTMAMSSLVPSASMEPISEWAADGNRMSMHNRSVSEPDFGRTPRQVDSKEETSSSAEGKTSGSVGGSRFGRLGFGSQLLQKTVGLVLRPRSGRQAKLGETNKFYYDEKLKRWVEEGAEPPAEEPAFAPPPMTSSFQNGLSDYNLKSALKNEGSPPNGSPTFKSPAPMEHASGIPPIPAGSNQFSARGRMGVRARYVDTFNQGSRNSAILFQSPSAPSVKPVAASNAKFFIPAPVQSGENSKETSVENAQVVPNAENPSTMTMDETATYSSPMTMQRFPSMDNISRKEMNVNGIGPLASHSRRTASWSGSFGDSFTSPPSTAPPKSLGEALGIPPSAYMPSDAPMPMNGGSFGDELQEVEL